VARNGVKTGGGSRKGIPNKATADVAAKLAALKCDPLTGMARIALNRKNPVELRAKMFAELAQYIAPKRKATEHYVSEGAAVLGLIVMPPKDP
jgi:hypothetical protein